MSTDLTYVDATEIAELIRTGKASSAGVQLVANWHAESTILHIASLLETLSPVRNQHPAI
jgi:hypothetical protein